MVTLTTKMKTTLLLSHHFYEQHLIVKDFLQKSLNEDNKILLFATNANLRKVSTAKFWLIDGTFSTVPLQYKQLYTIHGPVGVGENSRVVSLVYILMNKKTQEIYTAALEMLVDTANEMHILLDPTYIITDFEKAVTNASKEVFPTITSFGCYFHWSQNLIKKLSALGLKKKFSHDVNFYLGMKKIQAISFLPPDRIVPAYQELKPLLPPDLNVFLKSFEQSYLTG